MSPMQEQVDRSRQFAQTLRTLLVSECKVWDVTFSPGVSNETPDDEDGEDEVEPDHRVG